MDEGLRGARRADGVPEGLRAELEAVVGQHPLEAPAVRTALRSAAIRFARALVRAADGLSGVVASSAHTYDEARSVAVYCRTRPAVTK